jgi:hypothetical protein
VEEIYMVSFDEQCISASGLVTGCVLRHEHWRAFGYRKRPKQGKLWDLFVSLHERERREILGRELWAAAVGNVFYWALKHKSFDYRIHFMARLMSLCVDGIDKPIWPAFQFHTSHEALDFLQRACFDYGCSRVYVDFGKVFLQRCKAGLSTRLPANWLVGAAWLFSHSDSLFTCIIPALSETVWQDPDSDVNIADTRYLAVSEELFRNLEGE